MNKTNIAILYQAQKPPSKNGLLKPLKPGGYSDSGADIAYSLINKNYNVIVPVKNPDVKVELEWVFPDTKAGIQQAINMGANTFWLNTVLFSGHPIEDFKNEKIFIIGQIPANVEKYDNKFYTNSYLKENNLAIPDSLLVNKFDYKNLKATIDFPLIGKPVLGRGGQGVRLINNQSELNYFFADIFSENQYGSFVYLESYMSGQEVTVSVMPPGNYSISGIKKEFKNHWCLPPVKRFNHINGIAPYSGKVAIINNSSVMQEEILKLMLQCEKASALINSKDPIRIDCRADSKGKYYLFDLNMKPDMTGASRPYRYDQTSLTALAAEKIGWSYSDLIENILKQRWNINLLKA